MFQAFDTIGEMAMLQQRSFRRGRLSGQVVDAIEKMILEQYAQTGSRLPKEAELAEEFGVSRIVIREAMKILEDRGVVEVRAGSGTFTTAPSPDRVKHSLLRLFKDQPIPTLAEMERMSELRGVLEETVAGLAAVRATEENRKEMADALDAMANNSDVTKIIEADLHFHRAVARAAQNHYFEMVTEPLTEAFVQQIKVTDSYNVGVGQHREIYNAICKGDSVAARQAVRRLMRTTLEDIRKALRVLESPTKPKG
ncbi:MAG: FadR/GntR family transcriptional regulator [Bryobacteraceae bacterium]